MKKQIQLVLALAGLLTFGSASALIIDSFDFPADGDLVGIRNGAAFPRLTTTTLDVGDRFIGTSRTLSVTSTTPVSAQSTGELNGLTPDALDMQNSVVAIGTFTVSWDGIDHIDLTENGTILGFQLTIPEAIDNPLIVTFSAGAASVTRTFPNGTQGSGFFIPFGNQDFSDVTRLTASFTGSAGWDAVVQLIGTAPIPGTLLLMGVGLLGLARWGKRAGGQG
ncbi:hypothetical protein [uncultured Lamprocystis sp.]|jgi:hypothetical protein|uniref:hypothetical protein n=1 Tax=uncultured Lamprocystis sp. TaxID=543132 RepID=UPI0025D3DE67|nr:hypothetical protein [uncultured Lamprocystis sp.]